MQPPIAVRPHPATRTILVSFSPKAGLRSAEPRVREIVAALESAGYRARATCNLDELGGLACEWFAAGDLRCVIACGGDGTASVVRNHTPLEVPLLTVPLGTENLLGQYVEHSTSPDAIRETVDHGVSVALDLGRFRNEQIGQRYFLLMISAGFDAEVVRHLHLTRRGNITRRSYIQPTLSVIRSYEYPELRLYCHESAGRDSKVDCAEPVRCCWVFGFNLPLYARGWQVAPDAEATDGLIDVCTFHRGSIWHVARYLWHVMRKSHLRLSDANLVRCTGIRIEAEEGADVAFQVDGDFGGTLPVDVDVLPGQLRLLVMPHVAERLGFAIADETK